GLRAQPRLMEAGGGLQAPGDSMHLSCHGAGFTFKRQSLWWYRQAPGARLEWVSFIDYDSAVIKFGPSVQGRATASRDDFQSQTSLSLHVLHPWDSAHYICAVRSE
ncbi:HV03 protein, partial [Crotophaga sulcirostris]|nr:HV03 protein [Crotophaga sulcirostris]